MKKVFFKLEMPVGRDGVGHTEIWFGRGDRDSLGVGRSGLKALPVGWSWEWKGFGKKF